MFQLAIVLSIIHTSGNQPPSKMTASVLDEGILSEFQKLCVTFNAGVTLPTFFKNFVHYHTCMTLFKDFSDGD